MKKRIATVFMLAGIFASTGVFAQSPEMMWGERTSDRMERYTDNGQNYSNLRQSRSKNSRKNNRKNDRKYNRGTNRNYRDYNGNNMRGYDNDYNRGVNNNYDGNSDNRYSRDYNLARGSVTDRSYNSSRDYDKNYNRNYKNGRRNTTSYGSTMDRNYRRNASRRNNPAYYRNTSTRYDQPLNDYYYDTNDTSKQDYDTWMRNRNNYNDNTIDRIEDNTREGLQQYRRIRGQSDYYRR